MEKYQNRWDAGKTLAHQLKNYAKQSDVIVLGLPRGGVPVAYEIATFLSAPLDVFIVRKLGVPGHEELAFGALGMGNVVVFNQDIVQTLHISEKMIQKVITEEEQELQRRELRYRGNKSFPHLKNKKIILVDDGIATGATMRAAVNALRRLQPAFIIIAVPVMPNTIYKSMVGIVDKVVCPLIEDDFYAVGAYYTEFEQTTDEEVSTLLSLF
ncbi:MAG: phosphoribosyltransferase [Gammaproteobacteria bacterium]|nr:phosphoribosyltransferase [Gammaproteobacteria bacterium]